MSHLQGLLSEIDRHSAEAEPFQTLAAEVAVLPTELLERALVVAVSLPKSRTWQRPSRSSGAALT